MQSACAARSRCGLGAVRLACVLARCMGANPRLHNRRLPRSCANPWPCGHQVKQYFREYRARGKANAAPSGGGGDSSRGLSEARQASGDVGNDYAAGVPLSMPSAGGLLMAGSQMQGPPDTLDLLVASHNARINELNGTLASLGTLGSPFAAQTLPSSTFFGAARSSLPPPMWQHGQAPSSERFSAARTSILDGLGAALSDRHIGFGTGEL